MIAVRERVKYPKGKRSGPALTRRGGKKAIRLGATTFVLARGGPHRADAAPGYSGRLRSKHFRDKFFGKKHGALGLATGAEISLPIGLQYNDGFAIVYRWQNPICPPKVKSNYRQTRFLTARQISWIFSVCFQTSRRAFDI